MELRQLRYFIAIAEERNITRAAERLNIAQPPLGRQLTQLEHELGVRLVDRKSRPLVLTPAGLLLLEHAREILEKVEEMEAVVRASGDQGRHTLRMGFGPTNLYGLFPDVLRRLKAAESILDVQVFELNVWEQRHALLTGRIDLSFGRSLIEGEGIESAVLRRERLAAAFPCGHPLAGTRPVSLRALEAETMVVFPDAPRPSFADEMLALLARHQVRPKHVYEAQGLQTALGLVAAQVGVSLVPESVRSARSADVRYCEVVEDDAASMVTLSRRTDDNSLGIALTRKILNQTYMARGWEVPAILREGADG